MTVFRWIKFQDEWYPALVDSAQFFVFLASEKCNKISVTEIQELGPVIYRPIPVAYIPREPSTPAVSDIEVAKDVPENNSVERPALILQDFVEVFSKRNKDCGVVTLANILQITYKKARLITFHHGWSSTRGIDNGMLELILSKRGFQVEYRARWRNTPVRFFADNTPQGVFLVTCKDHVMPAINGRLMNCNGCGDRSIQEVYEVHKDAN